MTRGLALGDLWDHHWCATAEAGTARIAERASEVADAFRRQGGAVIRAPSDTMAFYANHSGRHYVLSLPTPDPGPVPAPIVRPALKPSPSPRCVDSPACRDPGGAPWPWSRQHPAIRIHDDDAVLDQSEEFLAVAADRQLTEVYMAGVHTNMCVLDRHLASRRWSPPGCPAHL